MGKECGCRLVRIPAALAQQRDGGLFVEKRAATSPATLLLAMTVRAADKGKVVDSTRRHSRAEIDCFATLSPRKHARYNTRS